MILWAGDLHILEKRELFEVVTIVSDATDEGLVASVGGRAIGVASQVQVAVVGHILGVECCGVVHKSHVVEELSKAGVSIIIQQVAENLYTVIDNDMNILIGIETIVLFVEIGTVAIKIGGIVTDFNMPDKPLHIPLALRVGGLVVMFDVDAGFLALYGVVLYSVLYLGYNRLQKKQQQVENYDNPASHCLMCDETVSVQRVISRTNRPR